MLFNSYFFIFLFLPITLLVYYRIGDLGHHRIATAWLVGTSLFFYGWWNPSYLGLILVSMLFNYSIGVGLSNPSEETRLSRKIILIFGIFVNLGLLGYFKYANFFVDNVNWLFNTNLNFGRILLPLAISFFTFQQIAYLVDAYRGETREYNFLHYCLFVTFFPQLIAGPIVHHREILPQFACEKIYRLNLEHLAVGLTIFFIGLFKKVVIADNISQFGTPVFDAAKANMTILFIDAWSGSLAYTFQLYFDFSGYSDMAVGIARMFGILLPINFDSPYKAINIIDFWRRWHMTLSRFLRDYVYIPLGGSHNGTIQRYINLMITMLIGGLWHGAGWTFVIWGGLHGFYLSVNHGWQSLRKKFGHNLQQSTPLGRLCSRIITFILVMISWVFFRAENLAAAANIISGMFCQSGMGLSDLYQSNLNSLFNKSLLGIVLTDISPYILLTYIFLPLCLIVFFAPNTYQCMINYKPALATYNRETIKQHHLQWKLNQNWGIAIGFLGLWALLGLSSVSEFLYFQF